MRHDWLRGCSSPVAGAYHVSWALPRLQAALSQLISITHLSNSHPFHRHRRRHRHRHNCDARRHPRSPSVLSTITLRPHASLADRQSSISHLRRLPGILPSVHHPYGKALDVTRVRGVILKQILSSAARRRWTRRFTSSAGCLLPLLRQSRGCSLLRPTDAIKARVGGIPLPLLRACFVARGHPTGKYTFLFP